jgi:hypothetical protein
MCSWEVEEFQHAQESVIERLPRSCIDSSKHRYEYVSRTGVTRYDSQVTRVTETPLRKSIGLPLCMARRAIDDEVMHCEPKNIGRHVPTKTDEGALDEAKDVLNIVFIPLLLSNNCH